MRRLLDERHLGRSQERRRVVLRHPEPVQLVALRGQRLEQPDGQAGQDEQHDEAADRHGYRGGAEPAVRGRLDDLLARRGA